MKNFSFNKKERVKSKKLFDLIYSKGKVLFSSGKKIKAVFIIKEFSQEPYIQITAAVSTKLGIAVWRNRIKRLIRESYRLNKNFLIDICKERKINLSIVFSPANINEKKNKKITLCEIMPDVIDAMKKISKNI